MNIKTNNHPRPVLYWHELTERERAEFDYLDSQDAQDSAQFFRYRGAAYDLGEFQHIGRNIAPHPQRPEWERFDGYRSDSFFSGLLVRFIDGAESVIVARYTC